MWDGPSVHSSCLASGGGGPLPLSSGTMAAEAWASPRLRFQEMYLCFELLAPALWGAGLWDAEVLREETSAGPSGPRGAVRRSRVWPVPFSCLWAAALSALSEGQTKALDLALGVWAGEEVVRWPGWGSTRVVQVGQGMGPLGMGVAGPSGTTASRGPGSPGRLVAQPRLTRGLGGGTGAL